MSSCAALLALPFVADCDRRCLASTTLATRIVISAIAAASLNLSLGYGGLVSFGHAAFFGVGGYAVGILYSHFVAGTPFLGLHPRHRPAPADAAGGDAGQRVCARCVLGALSLRTSGVQFIMITLAFAQMLFFLFVSLKAYGGDDGLIVRRRNSPARSEHRATTPPSISSAWRWPCCCFGCCAALVRSRFGLVLGGIRQNERRMAALGRVDLSLQAGRLRASPAWAPGSPAR